MEVIVVRRKYDYYEDSYTKILGVCMTESKADELIEIDKHKDDHPKMSKASWLSHKKYCYNCRERLEQNEEHGPKKSGFLHRFNYEGLNKVAKHAYDELIKKYDGMQYNFGLRCTFDDIDEYYLNQIFDRDLKDISYEDYKELDEWYSTRKRSEDPEDIYYYKEKYEVLE